jgi:hypothetical protein
MLMLQIILVLIGIALAAHVFLNKDTPVNTNPVVDVIVTPKPTPTPTPTVTPAPVMDNHDFMCLVKKWDDLRKCCHEQDLHQACDILNEQVFPLLNKVSKEVEGG